MKAYSILFLLTACFFQPHHLFSQEKPEPRFIEIYFENRDGERVTSLTYQDKFVYMVVVSENAIGEKLVLTMEEDDEDYIYKKRFLGPGDSIKEVIKKDIQKIKLTIYNPNKKKHLKLKHQRSLEPH